MNKTFECPLCGRKGLGKIINADGKEVLTQHGFLGVTSHKLYCEEGHKR